MMRPETRLATSRSIVDDDRPLIDPASFKDTLALLPSGVVIVTTVDVDGVPHGFTASTFCSVSLEPPLVSVCLARSARCHPVFVVRDTFVVNLLRPCHAELAVGFARSGRDKFADGAFRRTAGDLPALEDALAVLECTAYGRYEAGDHTILVGRVHRALATIDGEPLVFYRRAFHGVGDVLR